jgi:hypothetical protein
VENNTSVLSTGVFRKFFCEDSVFNAALGKLRGFCKNEQAIRRCVQLGVKVVDEAKKLLDWMEKAPKGKGEAEGFVCVGSRVFVKINSCWVALKLALDHKDGCLSPPEDDRTIAKWRAANATRLEAARLAAEGSTAPPSSDGSAGASPAAGPSAGPAPGPVEEGTDPLLVQLFQAVLKDEVAQVGDLLRANSDLVDRVGVQERSALHVAVSDPLRDHSKVIEELLAAKADVSLETADGKTALRLAVENGNGPAVQLLLASRPMSVTEIRPWIGEFEKSPNLQVQAAAKNLVCWSKNVASIAGAVDRKDVGDLRRLLETTRVRLDSTTAIDQPLLSLMSSSGWTEGLQALLELETAWLQTAVDPEYVKCLYQMSANRTENAEFRACAPLLKRLYIVVTGSDPDTGKSAQP